MNGRDWDDDSDYEEALARAGAATRVGWSAIAGVTGLVALAIGAVFVIGLLVLFGMAYVVAWR
ncbi:hypothetical protein ACFCV8_22235 [Streptomyces sp. NPDC056347]|uniref:hypothetical protein n=1 Tax=Streptomyces sp. NPDC056347 TaxID=3345790 RepID=UPI0035DA96B9